LQCWNRQNVHLPFLPNEQILCCGYRKYDSLFLLQSERIHRMLYLQPYFHVSQKRSFYLRYAL
jgi:hypothetical protein